MESIPAECIRAALDSADRFEPPPPYHEAIATSDTSGYNPGGLDSGNVVICMMNSGASRGPEHPLEGTPFSPSTHALLSSGAPRKTRGKDESDSEYEEPTKRRKVNKNGELRKVRKPRAFLRQWDEHDVTRALMGIVWAAGENEIRLPFDQAAQLVGETCTASALQQAILKIHSRLNDEGAQIPKIKMSWPSKAANPTFPNVGDRDPNKPDRRRRIETSRKTTQSFVVTLRCAYLPPARNTVAGPEPSTSDHAAPATPVATAYAHILPRGVDQTPNLPVSAPQPASDEEDVKIPLSMMPTTPGGSVTMTHSGMVTPQTSGVGSAHNPNTPAHSFSAKRSGIPANIVTPSASTAHARAFSATTTDVTTPRSAGVMVYTPTSNGVPDLNRRAFTMGNIDSDFSGSIIGAPDYEANLFTGMTYNDPRFNPQNDAQTPTAGQTTMDMFGSDVVGQQEFALAPQESGGANLLNLGVPNDQSLSQGDDSGIDMVGMSISDQPAYTRDAHANADLYAMRASGQHAFTNGHNRTLGADAYPEASSIRTGTNNNMSGPASHVYPGYMDDDQQAFFGTGHGLLGYGSDFWGYPQTLANTEQTSSYVDFNGAGNDSQPGFRFGDN